jgi:hypothetical protein
VRVYRLGLTLCVSVNVFGKIIYMLGKCKCILPIIKHVSVHVNIRLWHVNISVNMCKLF